MKLKKIISIAVSIAICFSCLNISSLASVRQSVLDKEEVSPMREFLKNNYKYESSEVSPEGDNEEDVFCTNRLIVSVAPGEEIDNTYEAVDYIKTHNDCYVLQYTSSEDAKVAYNLYNNTENVEWVEFDEIFTMDDVYGVESATSEMSVSSSGISWGSEKVASNIAKEHLNLINTVQNEVVVAVIDSGVEASHRIFKDEYGYSRVLNSDREMDNNPNRVHGTHVAGIIADNTNDNVKIRSYNYFWYSEPNETASITSLSDEIYYAIENGADVINLSLKGIGTSSSVKKAVKLAFEQGIVVVAGAGNDYADASNCYPANIPESITVAATKSDDTPKNSSNFGSCVDIAAPGEEILSAGLNGNLLIDSGTSMAAPFVSACAAMLKSIDKQFTCSEIEEIIESTVYVPENWDFNYGVGIVNFANCISKLYASTPKISFNSNYDVIITSSSPNETIYFTTDGSEPIVGASKIYSEPIDVTEATNINAVAYEIGKKPGVISNLKIKWFDNITIRYKGSKNINSKYGIKKYYCSDDDIISFDGKSIKGESIGNAIVTIFYNTGQRATYNVTVDFANYQWFHKIIYNLFGVLLWSL